MLEKWKLKAMQMNFKKALICFLIISLISVIAVPVTVFCNFENRIPELDMIVEKDREHENENTGAEKKDKFEDEEQKVVEHKETEHLQDEWNLSFKDIVLIVGCGIIGMVLCIWYWLLCIILAYRKSSRMGVNSEFWVLMTLLFNFAAIIVLCLYAILKGTCKTCGRIKVSGSNFCIRCGEPLKKKCQYCKQIVDINAAYCSNCGKKLDDNIK